MVVEVRLCLGVERLTASLAALFPPAVDNRPPLNETEEVLGQRDLSHSGLGGAIGVLADAIDRQLAFIGPFLVRPKVHVVIDHRLRGLGSVVVPPQILAPIWSSPAMSVT